MTMSQICIAAEIRHFARVSANPYLPLFLPHYVCTGSVPRQHGSSEGRKGKADAGYGPRP